MTHTRSRSKALWVYTPVLLAVLIMLPRLFSPQFGLFDDGKSLLTAAQLSDGDWGFHFDAQDGRFRPVYWLAFAVFYWIAGPHPFWFFLGSMLVFAATTFCLIQLLLNLGKSRLQAGLTGLAFALAGPIVENYYTLSKGEPWLVLFLALSLLAISRYGSIQSRQGRAFMILGVGLLQLLAHLAKEISVVVLPIALAWYLARRFTRQGQGDPDGRTAAGAYLAASLGSVACYLLLRTAFLSIGLETQGYSSRYVFSLAQIVASSIRWTGWLVRDFAYLLPPGIGAAVLWAANKKLPGSALVFDALVWTAGWVAVFLPWNFMVEYYMLPAAFGLAILAGALLSSLVSALQEEAGWKKWLGGLALGATALLFLPTVLTGISSARIQLAVDSANAQVLRTLADSAPSGATVLVNIQESNEYVDEIAMQLPAYYMRPDLAVRAFDFPELTAGGTYYILAPRVQGQPVLTVRTGVLEGPQAGWNESLQVYFGTVPGWEQIDDLGHEFPGFTIDLPRLLCPAIRTRSFCAIPSPLVDTRRYSYGWTIYRLDLP